MNACQGCNEDRGKREVFCKNCEENLTPELAKAMNLAQKLYKKMLIPIEDYQKVFQTCLAYLKIKVRKVRQDQAVKIHSLLDPQILFSLFRYNFVHYNDQLLYQKNKVWKLFSFQDNSFPNHSLFNSFTKSDEVIQKLKKEGWNGKFSQKILPVLSMNEPEASLILDGHQKVIIRTGTGAIDCKGWFYLHVARTTMSKKQHAELQKIHGEDHLYKLKEYKENYTRIIGLAFASGRQVINQENIRKASYSYPILDVVKLSVTEQYSIKGKPSFFELFPDLKRKPRSWIERFIEGAEKRD